MPTLTQGAQSYLAHYLRQMRTALRGHSSVDPDDIERDVLGHIDAELAGRPEPVDEGDLRRVLERLGAPRQWVPAEEQRAWWRVVSALRDGPEDWRLAYLALALALLGVTLFVADAVLWPLPALLPVVAFLMARATLELLDHHDEPLGARRWLIYPVLLPWYVAMAAALLLWPLAAAAGAQRDVPAVGEWIERSFPKLSWAVVPALGALGVGIWWICLGAMLRRSRAVVHRVFRPFGDGFDRRDATRIFLAGVLLAAGAGSILAIILTGF